MSQSSPESPPSHGAQRTRHSPPRHTPYGSENRRHPQNENRNTTGPGHQGDLHTQYMPYNNGSSGGYERTPFSYQNHDRPGRLPALTTVVNVDELSTQYGLDNAQRKAAHAFSKVRRPTRVWLVH